MSKLLDYLNTLDKDATAREAHAKNPSAAMSKNGLSVHEQDTVMSGDKKIMADLLNISAEVLPSIHVSNTAHDSSEWSPLGSFNHFNMQQSISKISIARA